MRTLAWSLAALLCLWVLVAAVSPACTPVRSEFANTRGFSRGLLNFVVLPAGQPFARAPVWGLALCSVVLLLAGTRGTQTRVATLLATSAIIVLAAVALSPVVSPYRIVLAPRTFSLLVLMICAARAADAARWVRARWTPLLSGVLGALFFASAMVQLLAAFGGNYSGFLHVSKVVARDAPFLQERPEIARSLVLYDAGYDGQFFYLMSFDPFLERFSDRPDAYRAFVDNPPYRYGRIGFSLLTRAVSAARPERYPAAMMWLIVAAHLALAGLLASRAAGRGLSPIAAMWYLAIPGFAASLMAALPEALAAAGIVAGVLCWETRRPFRAALAFGAAMLVRETAVIPLLAFVLAAGWREWRRSTLALAAALAPVCAWRLFVAWRLFPAFGWGSLAANPGDFGVPFAGLIRLWVAGATRTQAPPEISAALVFPVLLAAAFGLAMVLLKVHRGPLEAAAAVYAVVAVSLNYSQIWSHLPSGERGTFELFLCLLLIRLDGGDRPSWVRRALTGFFAALVAYTFFAAPEAGASRAALLLIR